VLVRNDLRAVPRIIALNEASYRKLVQNHWWACWQGSRGDPLAAVELADGEQVESGLE
jgi:P-type Cu2+ transporter